MSSEASFGEAVQRFRVNWVFKADLGSVKLIVPEGL